MSRKVDENRVRRMAERQRLCLRKNRRRDPHAYDFGTYELTEQDGRVLVKSANLGIIERHLTTHPCARPETVVVANDLGER